MELSKTYEVEHGTTITLTLNSGKQQFNINASLTHKKRQYKMNGYAIKIRNYWVAYYNNVNEVGAYDSEPPYSVKNKITKITEDLCEEFIQTFPDYMLVVKYNNIHDSIAEKTKLVNDTQESIHRLNAAINELLKDKKFQDILQYVK